MNQNTLLLLFERLRKEEKDAMAALYVQTSAHLYAIAARILHDERTASDIIKSVFVSIWDHRHHPRFSENDILNELRIMTHRTAIEYKLTQQILKPIPNTGLNSDQTLKAVSALNALSEEDLGILSSAYLDALPLGALAEKYGTNTKEMKRHLSKILSVFSGDVT